MTLDLDTMSLKELKNLQSRVGEKIATYEERKKKEALAALDEKAKELGYSLTELVGALSEKRRTPAKPKYANPDDRSQTWTGRGRRPRWVEAALRAGRSIEDLAI